MNQKDHSEPDLHSRRKLFFGLFIFPLLIAAGMAALLCTAVLLTHEKETPESLLESIKTGSAGKRWQKAFELSNELNRNAVSLRADSLIREMIHILEDSTRYDSKTRAYMAIALSHFNAPEVISALRNSLSDNDSEVKIYSLWAAAVLKDRSLSPDCQRFLKSDDPELRKVAAYALGALGDPASTTALRPALNDPAADVRWNAALSLARLGDDSGFDILIQMLDRQSLRRESEMNAETTETVMINAIKGLTLIAKPYSIRILQNISKNDPSLKVRQVAIESLRLQKEQWDRQDS